MQPDLDEPTAESAVTSPSPAQRERSFTATASDRMRANRSSSRISHGTPSRHSDEDSSKTAVKVGKCGTCFNARVSIADPFRIQSFEYDLLSIPTTLATTLSLRGSVRAHAKSPRT
jgi:hypothetical protein